MKRLLKYTVPALFVLLAACSDEMKENIPTRKPGEKITVGATFGIDRQTAVDLTGGNSIGGATRSITVADGVDEMTGTGDLPKNFWMLQYDQTGTLVGSPTYIDLVADGVPEALPVLHSGGETHTLIFLANMHNPDHEWGGEAGTLENLKKRVAEIQQETDCYLQTSAGNFLLMNAAITDVFDGTNDLRVVFHRNIAKLTFQIKNESSDLTIQSVQLCNVATYIHYADEVCMADDGVFPMKGTTPYMYYPAEELMLAPGASGELNWYLPRNEQGISASTLHSQKSKNAPLNATYIRILAKDAEGRQTSYTVYPGMNMTDDYNIKANHHHKVFVAIHGTGDPHQDSRIDNLHTIDFASANSFILNPASGSDAQRVFTFPIIQANKFWHTYDPTYEIGPRTKWVATLIWQDVADADLIRFVEDDGTLTTSLARTGTNPRIRVTVKNGAAANALIGIRPADDSGNPIGEEFLWSWHLWITDYNPDAIKIHPVAGQYIYPLDENGNAVHRYSGTIWDTGIYKEKYIMDRNLGQRYEKDRALYYQFGRKDPWHMSMVYDMQGQPIGITPLTGPVSLGKSVQYPGNYISHGTNWASDGTTNRWNDPVAGDKKSIFDPCPYGWRIPSKDTWIDFRYNVNDPTNSTLLHESRPEIGSWNTGTYYWPFNATNENSLKIFYLSVGSRSGNNGANNNINQSGVYWSDETYSTYQTYTLTFNGGAANNSLKVRSLNIHRSNGATVRCIQE